MFVAKRRLSAYAEGALPHLSPQLIETGGIYLGGFIMILILQIPFVDFRVLCKKYQKQIFLPNTFIGRNGKHYYRYFGLIHPRRSCDGLLNSEKEFFESKKVISLKKEMDHKGLKIVFQRLFCDGIFYHFDLGLYISDDIIKQNYGCLIEKSITSILNRKDFCVSSKLNITNPICLNSLSDVVKKYYIYATTKIKYQKAGKKLVRDRNDKIIVGNPATFIIADNIFKLKKGNNRIIPFTHNETYQNEIIKKGELIIGANRYDIWVVDKHSSHNNDMRSLRVCLSKLHCYKEGIARILKFADNSRFIPNHFDYDLLLTSLTKILTLLKDYQSENNPYHFSEDIMVTAFKGVLSVDELTWKEYISSLDRYIDDMSKQRQFSSEQFKNNFSLTLSIIELLLKIIGVFRK